MASLSSFVACVGEARPRAVYIYVFCLIFTHGENRKWVGSWLGFFLLQVASWQCWCILLPCKSFRALREVDSSSRSELKIKDRLLFLMMSWCSGTFWRIVKHRSTQEFESLPYVCALLSSALWTCYGIIKPGEMVVATVNGFGVAVEAVYVALFLIYSPAKKRVGISAGLGHDLLHHHTRRLNAVLPRWFFRNYRSKSSLWSASWMWGF